MIMSTDADQAQVSSLRELCLDVAGKREVAAACEFGESVYSIRAQGREVLVVVEDYADGLRYHARRLNGRPVMILAADRSLVDLDARKGAMGEFIVERLLTPYRPLQNAELLESIEVDAKERILREELTELVLEYGGMARELSIQEEYLMLARIRKRARVFLSAARSCSLLLDRRVRETNLRKMAPGYRSAIRRLVDAGVLREEGPAYSLVDSFIDRSLRRHPARKAINIVQAGRRTLQAYLAHGKATYLTPDILTRELVSSLGQGLLDEFPVGALEDPRKYLSLKTTTGLVSLAERFSIEKFAGQFRPGVVVTVTPLGNALNEVYLITAGGERLVAKKFTEWQSFKWFALGLVSLGTRFFSVSGKARLENEYAVNRLLSRHRLPVPEVLHISLPDRVLVERYVEGSSLVALVKKAVSGKSISEEDRTAVSKVGSTLASMHAAGVAMGDSKPENFQRGVDNEVYCLDLEQAKKPGDKAWDVAEFLYYSGHYVFPTMLSAGFKEYVEAFIHGYRTKGDMNVLKAAAGAKYGRVFSLWTPPLVILEISKSLKNAA
jgi:tRNA A-37 threonylcarbamoyl transferase component Bud32